MPASEGADPIPDKAVPQVPWNVFEGVGAVRGPPLRQKKVTNP